MKFFFFLFLLLFAWHVYSELKDQSADNAIISAWLVASIGGIIGSLNLAHRSSEEKVADAVYTKFNPGDGAFNEGMGCFMRIILAVLLAPLFTVAVA